MAMAMAMAIAMAMAMGWHKSMLINYGIKILDFSLAFL